MAKIIDVLTKYVDKPLSYGTFDCNLMVLELTGFDTTKIKPYSTLKEGAVNVSDATQCCSPLEYIQTQGYKQINPLEASDGCLVVDKIHCFIYFNGCLFGVHKETQCFKYMNITINELQKLKVYKLWLD
ncbi:hypothetical protein L4D00_14940 [Photobacterium swingsii]|uniref:hypothetical protein n=1 Tax=Photobacterium swingsii TaxID=680026 RepID=UPI003D13D2DF